ncbi:doublecortin domain-containing protein 2B [Myripristis murdjan]|uniref:doublecortin domain-containing protein 2B n=1 Tax=Myripristis murdjan TaxID=586833 RepID=UPI001175EBC6|nr:doublecortin domain-containing protein 2B-like [Myripristis murdjan]
MAASSGASSAATVLLPPVKSVVVYRNGDPFYCGRRFVVNQRQVATMEAFLNDVTQSIGAPLAVRTLYTPRQGHRVTDLQELQTGGQYVAAGFERFKKLDYLNTGVKKQPVAQEGTQARLIQRPNVSAKWRKFIPVPCIIHVFRNGDPLCPPFRFIIPRSLRQDLEQILSLVTEKVSLRTGAVRRLCSLEGVTVSSAGELETGHCYVAVGTERFKKLPYVDLWVSKATERCYPGKRRLLRRTENRKAGSGPEDRYSDSALLDSPESDGRRVKSTGDEAAEVAAPQATQPRTDRKGAEESSVFYTRPVKIRRNRGQPRTSISSGPVQPSVFKRGARRRREEARGAEEVPEDENTVTELPVDQRAADIVEDEELNERDGFLPNTEQVKSPEQDGMEQQPVRENQQTSGVTAEHSASAEEDCASAAAVVKEPEPKLASSNSRASPSASLGSPTGGAIQGNNREGQGEMASLHSPNPKKESLQDPLSIIVDQPSCQEGAAAEENRGHIKEVTSSQ